MRQLTRTITRRIAGIVVSMTPEGLIIRGFRKRAKQNAKLLTWTDILLASGANIRSSRLDAFRYEPSTAWVPKPLDDVYLHPKHRAARGVVVHIHPELPEPFITVELKSGKPRLVPLSDLRPAPHRDVKKTTGGQKEFARVE